MTLLQILVYNVAFGLFAFLFIVWAYFPQLEQVWFMVPVLGLYRMIAGTWKKAVNRFLSPALIGVCAFLFLGWSWWLIGAVCGYLLLMTLPMTLIGDGLDKHWFNWIWVWVLGFLQGVPAVFIAIPANEIITWVWLCLFCGVIFGAVFTLSNLKETRKYFPWKFCEFIFGSLLAITPTMLIQMGA